MKKIYVFMMAMAVATAALTGCKGGKMKTVRGLVASVDVDGDTLKHIRVVADGDTLTMKTDFTEFRLGTPVAGDSAIVDYASGKDDSLQALSVNVLQRAPRYLEVKPDAPLKTR